MASFEIGASERDALEAIAAERAARLSPAQRETLAEIRALSEPWRTRSEITDSSEAAQRVLERVAPDNPTDLTVFWVASLALELPERLSDRRLPASVTALYPTDMRRFVDYLSRPGLDDYYGENEAFRKDLRQVCGLAVRSGLHLFELRGRISAGMGVKHLLRSRRLMEGLRLTSDAAFRPWFDLHIDDRYVEEFSKEGWGVSLRRVAETMRTHPEVAGTIGTSWFFDPVVKTITPHLGFLIDRPLAHGGLIVRHKVEELHTRWATETSKTRRKAYERGEYQPIVYSMIWPREPLLAWAESDAD
jgi:hypothetical protein